MIAPWLFLGTFALSALLTGVVRRVALRRGVLDVPNERSSHRVPTARGGGIAIVASCLVGWLVDYLAGGATAELALALSGGGLLVAGVGLRDDYRSLTPVIRLLAHFAAASWAVYFLGGMPDLQLGATTYHLGLAGSALAVLGVVWVVNLFNFMDGIDGIAASEAVFVAAAGFFVGEWATGGGHGLQMALVVAASSLGFLCWNWPPARIFMGDVGSGFLGFAIAVLAIAAAREYPAAILVWLVLGALFFVDATVTLLWRLARRERVHQAHRSHAYQHLAVRQGHLRVTLGSIAMNVLVLLPCAFWIASKPEYGAAVSGGVMLGLVFLATLLNAGRR